MVGGSGGWQICNCLNSVLVELLLAFGVGDVGVIIAVSKSIFSNLIIVPLLMGGDKKRLELDAGLVKQEASCSMLSSRPRRAA